MHRGQIVAGVLRHKTVKCFSSSSRIRKVQASRTPPPQTTKLPSDPSSSSTLTPEIWGALQLPADAALHAFANRIGLGSVLISTERIQQVCTHPSFVPFFSHYNPTHPTSTLPSNGTLAVLGNSLLGLFAAEHLHVSYPHLPGKAIKAAVTAFVGPTTCATIAREFGANPLVRWRRTPSVMTRPAVLLDDALASIPRSIVAALYQDRSLDAARKFFNDHFINRELDLRALLRFRDPKLSLRKTVEYFQRESPKSR
jgi:large subunit ribosomal protein L44